MSKQTKRQGVQSITGLSLSSTRIKRHLHSYGVNQELQKQIDNIDAELYKFKKAGAPAVIAERPARLPQKADLEAKTKRAQEAEVYQQQEQAFRQFSSDNYVMLKVAHEFYLRLASIHELLSKKDLTPSAAKSLKEETENFAVPFTKRAKENAELYARREAARKAVFAKLKVDLTNKDTVGAAMKQLENSYPGMDLFIKRDGFASKRIRINEPAVVAVSAVVESVLRELATHSMNTVLNANKKKILVDHCIEDTADKDLYPLYFNLPTYVRAVDRQRRREVYEEDKKAFDDQRNQRAREYHDRHKVKGERFSKPDSTYPTFGETEVKANHARALPLKPAKEGAKRDPKQKYEWYGIDVSESDGSESFYDEDQFDNYITAICDSVKATDKLYYDPIRVSSEIRHFFSNITIDLIKKFAPVLKELVEFSGTKTITKESVILATRLMLFSSQHMVDSYGNINEKYDTVFGLVDESTKLITTHRATVRENAANGVAAAAASETVVQEPSGESLPEPVQPAKKATPPVLKGKEIRRPAPKQ